ncbi:MAG: cysteine--tRNA ligase [Candidatus Paralactobacillus gallistercoris]|uniref:Cysteine--tRNA ligase n=1 Tax=Candidatus Paralactobacillus gallistercoris TaxID=2838724 RepID=A0A948X0U0_9LACO|nr:cysteine--tRNA ligase [Candidatus Paralactobacillus gallistercoris]
MQLFNTLTQQKEEFKPIVPGKVTMYVCGPTVYNYIHIGNARSVVAFDTIRRYLEYRGYQVEFVSNFTDVDDKMIKQARQDGISVAQLADKYINAYREDTAALNIKPATLNPRATENITDIINFVNKLIDEGYAYVVDGNVYYRTRKFKDYGKLSGQNIDELEEGASQHVSNQELALKEDPIDFALWKAQKEPDEIAWQSPWGMGRPGWHIECSVMATKYLAPTIDIHGGGQDLEFPHHENEIAQSQARYGQTFVHYWLHNGFVTVGKDAEKMSKSLGNFITVHELIKQVDPQVVRFFLASTQYRHPINYTQQALLQSKETLNKLKNAFDNLSYRHDDAINGQDDRIENKLQQIINDFITAMDDDINVQNGLTAVYALAKLMNEYAEYQYVYRDTLEKILKTFTDWLMIFGISFQKQTELLPDDINQLINERNMARQQKNFARSDEIRDMLRERGIILEDTPQGTRWRREN